MTRLRRALVFGWMLVVLPAFSCRSTPATSTASPAHRARLISVEGDVRLKRSAAADYEAATVNAVLEIADLVSTGPSGHATIAFDDGSTAMITPRSMVAIEPPAASASSGIAVQRGRVEIEVSSDSASHFRIKTPDADADVPARTIDVVGRR